MNDEWMNKWIMIMMNKWWMMIWYDVIWMINKWMNKWIMMNNGMNDDYDE